MIVFYVCIQYIVVPSFFRPTSYERSDEGCVEKVKAVYESVNSRQLYAEYEEQSYQNIGRLIN